MEVISFPLDKSECEHIATSFGDNLWPAFWAGALKHMENGGKQSDVDSAEHWLLFEKRTSLYWSYMDLFVNRTDLWGQQYSLKEGGVGYYIHKPSCPSEESNFCKRGLDACQQLCLGDIHSMVEGSLTISLPALDINGASKWCCWDFDAANGARSRLKSVLERMGLKSYEEATPSPGKEGHLWLFFQAPIQAELLLLFAQGVERAITADVSGFSYSSSSIEFFPKYSDGRYSQIRAPLGKHRKADARNGYGYFEEVSPGIEKQLAFIQTVAKNNPSIITSAAEYMRTVLHAEASEEREKLSPRIKPINTDYSPKEEVNALHYVEARRSGKQWVAQCPLCALEGHDTHKNNLHISHDGLTFNCVYGGPNTTHKTIELVNYFRQR